MADIRYKYRTSEYTLNSFDDVLKTVNWIRDAMRAVFQDYGKLDSRCYIQFESGDLSYDCNSLDEFKQYAFGKEICVKALSVFVSKNWIIKLISLHAVKQGFETEQEYILSSTDEKLLVELRDALKANKKGLQLATSPVVINCEKHEDNSVHIGNNSQISNSVIGSKNTAEIEQEIAVPEGNKESLASKIKWRIVVPIVVGVIIAAIVFYWLNEKMKVIQNIISLNQPLM